MTSYFEHNAGHPELEVVDFDRPEPRRTEVVQTPNRITGDKPMPRDEALVLALFVLFACAMWGATVMLRWGGWL